MDEDFNCDADPITKCGVSIQSHALEIKIRTIGDSFDIFHVCSNRCKIALLKKVFDDKSQVIVK